MPTAANENVQSVMAGLVPAIHVFLCVTALKTWMPATSAGMTKKSNK
jgi:hypothetical protein